MQTVISPRIKFTDDENALAIMTLNRHQNRFDLYFANPRSTLCKLMVRDEAPNTLKKKPTPTSFSIQKLCGDE